MQPLVIAEPALNSAAFLRSVLAEYQNLSWDQSSAQLQQVQGRSTDARLVIQSQALTLQQVADIQQNLSAALSVHSFSLHPFDELLNHTVVVAAVDHSCDDDELVKAVIAKTAEQHHCEIALLEHTPKLSEPGLLVMDMDSTVIQIECIDEIAKLAGLGDKVAAVTEQAMRGELAFKDSLISRVACLDGVQVSQLAQIRNSIPLMPGLSKLLEVLKANGWKVAIASGGFTYFAGYLEERLGLDASRANVLAEENGVLTGNVIGDIVDAEVKAETVKALAAKWDIPMHQTVAMGDGANDLKMMDVAALGVAFEAKPIVNAQANAAIRYSGLDAMLAYLCP
ncbi:phosphoserine phosphatase [Marisediminitalea aggregata]|uniref:Phosphoserine phosphatase n=1 Tax=Marisediminitalea aggregata TaxID=634436 RepID=A0A1M5L3U3_9ALTE|nr:phosphoserine phosphatase SerB [Marisediminitalea aggregata]MEC7469689.1 phosphoserine phosphatase SerB [Pseudomonadota bacterium]MEC7825702.1 phosphoserine phosphatase SerB [Pseudomonadota bacterium]SHG59687.1 phosphoserine phosphatase [Marisediminitalea aggregata]